MNYIIKRDGIHQPFNKDKIVTAILKAFIAVDGSVSEYAQQKANNIADYIENQIKQSNAELNIDEIQQLVEHGLMSCKRKDVAIAYIEYRHDRDFARKNTVDDTVDNYQVFMNNCERFNAINKSIMGNDLEVDDLNDVESFKFKSNLLSTFIGASDRTDAEKIQLKNEVEKLSSEIALYIQQNNNTKVR